MSLLVHKHLTSEIVAWAVEAFEAAVALDSKVGIWEFIPMANLPYCREVTAELVRVDMERTWRQGNPSHLDEYLRRFPLLASETKTLNSVAFEEYRQRRLCGELVEPEEYEHRYAIDVTLWPPILPRHQSSQF